MAATVEIHGVCDHRFREVHDAFAENFAHRGEVGAAVSVTVEGHHVVDLWAGHADEQRTSPWERDTITCVFSCTKAMAALCAHRLVDQGLLDLDAPVARYWPEFAQGGKEELPVRYLLSHRAGLPAVKEPLPLEAHYEWERMIAALERQEPWWEPGAKFGYHTLTFGWLVGELVRRVSGKRSLGAYFREEVAEPLGLDYHIGFGPEHDPRAAEIILAPPPENPPPVDPAAAEIRSRWSGASGINLQGMIARGMMNTREWRAAEIPAANGYADARAQARVYGALAVGGEMDGVRVLSREAIEAAMVEQSNETDQVNGMHLRFGLGFVLPHPGMYLGPSTRVIGHAGAGGALGFADLDAGVGFGYVMNQMQGGGPEGDPRWRPLIDAAYVTLG